MRILIIEDDQGVTNGLELLFKSKRFVVESTTTGQEGIEIGKFYEFDAIILDIGLPDMNGYNVLQRLRNSKIKTPVLIISGQWKETQDKIRALGFGADDFLIKPFDSDELVARVEAVIRRYRGHCENLIRTGKLCVNLGDRTASVNNETLQLTSKEYGILELLSIRKGITLTKEMFLNHLYGGIDEPELKIIDVFICKLRKKLEEALSGDAYIETVWGRGYVLRDPHDKETQKKKWRQNSLLSSVLPPDNKERSIRIKNDDFLLQSSKKNKECYIAKDLDS